MPKDSVQPRFIARPSNPEVDYHTIFNAVKDGISVHDPATGAILDVNPATCAMLGRSREELLAIDVSDASAPRSGQTQRDVQRLIQEAAKGRSVVFEWVLVDRNGREVPIEVSLKSTTLRGRHVVVAVTRDCSERQRSEERIRLLSSAVEQSSEGIAAADMSGELLYVNRALAMMHGYRPDELVGKHLSIFHTDEQMPAVNAANQVLQARGEFSGEIMHVRRDGTVFPTLMHNWLLRDEQGRAVAMIGTMRDISEQKQAEKALITSEKRYRELYEASLDGYAMTTMDGTIVEANAAMLALLGRTREQVIGRNFRDITPSRWHEMEDRLLERQLFDRGHTERYEKEYIRGDGSIVPVEIRTYLARDAQGAPTGMWAYVRDISERKRREREQAEQLERARRQQAAVISLSTHESMVDGDWDAFKRLLTKTAAESSGVDRVTLWLLDEDGFQLRCVDVFDRRGTTNVDRPVLSLADAPRYLEAIMTQRTLACEDACGSPETHDLALAYFMPNAIRSVVQAPIRTGGWPAGVLSIEHRGAPRRWQSDEIAFAAALADQASLALLSAERAKSSRALLKSEERFRTIADFTYDWEYWISPEGRMLYVSPSCERISGFSSEDFLTDPELIVRITHPDDREAVRQHLRGERRHANEDAMTFRIRTRSGEERWIDHSCLPVYDTSGRFLGRRASNRDITERQLAQQALRENEEKYRTLVETMSDGLAVVDHSGRLTFANRRLGEILDRRPEAVIGRNVSELFGVAGDEMLAALGNGEDLSKGEVVDLPVARSGADTTYVSVSSRPFEKGPAGRQRSLLVVTDVTEQRELQERIAQAEKMETVGRLAGGVAHDLNNVLCGVVTYPDLLLRQMSPDDPSRELIQAIKKSGERAAAVVSDLLTLARRGGRTESVFNLNAVVEDYLRSPELEVMLDEAPSIRVTSDLAGDLPSVKGSEVQFAKTVMNLVTNAVEAIATEGAVTISTAVARLSRAEADRLGLVPGEYVRLSVADTGSGIPADLRHKIFEPFFSTKRMDRSGTGLGLSVVWGTVTDHAGAIDVDSAEGEGTTFRLYFPAVRESPAPDKPDQPDAIPMGCGQTVLVVDDQSAQCQVACQALRALSYRPSAVHSGEEAVEILKDIGAGVVLLDMLMPSGMDGLDTYRRIREVRPDQKVVLMGGYAETERVLEAQRLGAGPFLRKPYTVDQLAELLHNVLTEDKTSE